nr:MAG TPA: hypothetical protein [Caudoviricetes sp.]
MQFHLQFNDYCLFFYPLNTQKCISPVLLRHIPFTTERQVVKLRVWTSQCRKSSRC